MFRCGLLKLGPPLGHSQQMNRQFEVGELDEKWVREYGTVWRLKGIMGVSEFLDHLSLDFDSSLRL